MSKRPAGTGTVRTLRAPTADKPGRYQALGPRNAKGRRTSLYCGPDRAEAERWAAEGARQMAAGEAVHLTGITLRAWGERYLDGRERDSPASTYRTERSAWHHVEDAPWIDDPIDSLRTPAIQAHLVALARRHPGSARTAKALLSQMMGEAARAGHVVGNPVLAVKLPRLALTHEPWTYLLPEEQAALLAAPLPELDHHLLAVAMYTGMRLGEVLALRIADVHLAAVEVVVRYGSLHGPPKGRKVRPVHLFPPALEALRRWLAILPEWLDGTENRYGLVFPGPGGGARQVGHALERRRGKRGTATARTEDGWTEALELAGILRNGSAAHRHDGQVPTPHTTRHTCGASLASGWWGEAWSLEQIRTHLRHRSIKETERYAHLAPSAVRAMAARIEGVGVTNAMEHNPRVSSGFSDESRQRTASTSGAASAAVRVLCAPSVTHRVAEALVRVDAALDAAARKDPYAGRRAVEALGMAREALQEVVGLAVAADDAPTRKRGRR